ncbi:MAG: adenylyl-sulfate kinase [Patescibacteria group bacterium]
MNNIKNIIFLSIDALRFDMLRYAGGYQLNTTPSIDFLCKNGIYCANAFTPGNPTQFGFPSIFTSTMPLDFGSYNEGIKNRPISFPEILKKKGIKTCGMTNNVNINNFFYYDRGFDEFYEFFDIELFWNSMKKNYFYYYRELYKKNIINKQAYYEILRFWLKKCFLYMMDFCNKRDNAIEIQCDYIAEWHDYEILKKAISSKIKNLINNFGNYHNDNFDDLLNKNLYDFLGIVSTKPAIGKFINHIDKNIAKLLKNIYIQFDERYSRKIKGDKIAKNIINWIDKNSINPFFIWAHFMDLHDENYISKSFGLPHKLASFIAKRIFLRDTYRGNLRYDFSLNFVDRAVGCIIKYLRNKDLLDSSLIVICGDHGHRTGKPYRKGSSAAAFYEEDIKVPLIFYNPKFRPKRIEDLCCLRDIAPSIFSFLGIEQVAEFEGKSVIDRSVKERDYVILENNFRGPCDFDNKPIYLAVRTDKYKYVHRESISFNDPWSKHKQELYNLNDDPKEYNNLYDHPEYVNVLNKLEKIAVQRIQDIRSSHGKNNLGHTDGKGFVLWLTGLSGSGKTTYANRLYTLFGIKNFKILDGDEFRQMFSADLGYTYEDRILNIKRIAYYAHIISSLGINVIVANIAPFYEARDFIRQNIHNYIQVYLKADIEVLKIRDPKGLYARSKARKIGNVIGIHEPYQEPRTPDVVIDTGQESVEDGVQKIITYLRNKKIIQ